MGKNQLLDDVEKLAYQYEQQYGGCSQCVVGALKKLINGISDDVFKAATAAAGGIGCTTQGSCGALQGGLMVLSVFLGREYANFADPKKIRWETFQMSKELLEKFNAEYGSGICKEIQKGIMGRSFDMWDDQDYQEFLAAGGHEDKCPAVCGKAARWTVEILQEKGLI